MEQNQKTLDRSHTYTHYERMKPDTRTAMHHLIGQIRNNLPLDAPESVLCSDHCRVCSKKLLEFVGSEIDGWEYKLAQGQTPNFGDLQRLGKTARKVHTALSETGLITAEPSNHDKQ